MLSLIIFMFILCILFGIHILYPVILKSLLRNPRSLRPLKITGKTSQIDLPLVTIIIPVYNEEPVIERRINNILESKYPKDRLEIFIIDSGSTDKTRTIIRSKFQGVVTLLTEEDRRGKAHAINLALPKSNGALVILTDGATLYNNRTILHLVNTFSDNTIGAVSALYDVPNREASYVTGSEHKFWLHKDSIRILESKVHSTSWLSGEACAFRNGIVSKIDEDTLADDSNVALQVISKGYRSVVNEEAHFTESSPTETVDYFMVKSRRALGGLIETLRFKRLLFSSRSGYFGMVIFPYRFFVYVFSPILSCLAAVLAILTSWEMISHIGIYPVLVIGVIFAAIFLIVRDKMMIYFYTQLFTITALLWLIVGNVDVRWSKSKTR